MSDRDGPPIDSDGLALSLRRLAEGHDHADLHDALRLVVTACVKLFGVAGSGLMFADEAGELRYVVAEPGPNTVFEQLQIAAGQGPCVDAYLLNEVTYSPDLSVDDRYPLIAADLEAAGVLAVLGVPVRLGGMPVGSLDVFHREAHEFDGSELDALVRYGAVVEATLQGAIAADRAGELAAQMSHALNARVPIERGIGYLMARDGVDATAAFDRLRAAARACRRRVGDVAADLLTSHQLPDEQNGK